MIVDLPRNFDRESMYQLIDQTIDSDMEPRSKEIIFNFVTLKFIRPVGVTVLSNLIGRLKKYGVRVTFQYPHANRKNRNCPISFLDDSMFFKHFLKETLDISASLRGTTMPLENVSYSGSYQYLSNAMRWLSHKLNLTEQSLGDIEMCLQEVFNNIQDHSAESSGSVFIQHYPTEKTVMIAISDFGVGIPHNIQRYEPFLNDAEALRLSIKEGYTTKTSPRNLGAGLFTLLQNVVINNKGSVYIHSNHGILNCNYDGTGIELTQMNHKGFYPGTLLEINFRTDTIENIEEEFSWE